MPAITATDLLVLPRVERPAPTAAWRAVTRVVPAQHVKEGAGFEVWRPFPGALSMQDADPFLLLDQLGPTVNAPNEAKGAPWHPHRGFETVTYLLDGEVTHHDSNGGGGTIGEGDTQWMTAGAGILHDELPSEATFARGGLSHGVQLWVNLPSALKFTPARYQAITKDNLVLLTSHDGGVLIRVIAGSLAGHDGPGVTHTPITYSHATIEPGAGLDLPWRPDFSAMVYVLAGQGFAGREARPIRDHDLVLFGPGDAVTLRADEHQVGRDVELTSGRLDVLLLGGARIGESIAHYGPFVMNTRAEILTALDDYQAGRMGVIPAVDLS
jgi:quercetin 2,3-dioxygenase